MAEKDAQKKGIAAALGLLAMFKLVLAIFAWWGRDPEAPVKWGELRWIFLLEFLLFAYIVWRLHWYNWALYG